jgi:hypothetical protein
VFARSFAALVAALVLLRDNDRPFLEQAEWRRVQERLVAYAAQEADLRGLVPGRGWAHAAAHAGDALDECVRCRYATARDCEQAWRGLASLIDRAGHVYDCEEDERIAVALARMVELERVRLEKLAEWIAGQLPNDEGPFDEIRVRRTNWKHLVRSLYFRLQRTGHAQGQLDPLVRLSESLVQF